MVLISTPQLSILAQMKLPLLIASVHAALLLMQCGCQDKENDAATIHHSILHKYTYVLDGHSWQYAHEIVSLSTCKLYTTQEPYQLTLYTNNSNIFMMTTVLISNTSMAAVNKLRL